ncbi:NAD(P)-binding protein, partial [Bacillus cereus]
MYDVTIIGAGVSSIFMAYSLAKSNKKVLILDKGKALEDRHCPLDEGKVCNCTTCDKYFGFGGLGKSEGKFNYTNGFGGELEKKVGKEGFIQLMAEVDEILCQ